MVKTPKELIEEGKRILEFPRRIENDCDNVISASNVEIVKKWAEDLDMFKLTLDKSSYALVMLSANEWILNHNRISPTRITNIIKILEEL